MAEVPMTLTDCWCGLPFSMPKRLYDECKANGTTFYCPIGHSIVFKISEATKYRREAERLRQRIAEKDDDIAAKDRQLSAAKGQVTKLRKRVSHGVCPCCNRTFQNLARHMATKHPDEVQLKQVS